MYFFPYIHSSLLTFFPHLLYPYWMILTDPCLDLRFPLQIIQILTGFLFQILIKHYRCFNFMFPCIFLKMWPFLIVCVAGKHWPWRAGMLRCVAGEWHWVLYCTWGSVCRWVQRGLLKVQAWVRGSWRHTMRPIFPLSVSLNIGLPPSIVDFFTQNI